LKLKLETKTSLWLAASQCLNMSIIDSFIKLIHSKRHFFSIHFLNEASDCLYDWVIESLTNPIHSKMHNH